MTHFHRGIATFNLASGATGGGGITGGRGTRDWQTRLSSFHPAFQGKNCYNNYHKGKRS